MKSTETLSPENYRLRRIATVAVGLIVAILSLLTSLPGVGFIDSGEMAAAAATLGVPHPTGYPILMILGRVFALPFAENPATGLNLLNALLAGGSGSFLLLLFARFLRPIPSTSKDARDQTMRAVYIPAAVALLIATSTIWWSVGTGFEAYALHAFFLTALSWAFLRFTDEIEERGDASSRTGLLFALLLGLSFSNHLTTAILAPAFLIHYGVVAGVNGTSVILLGLLPYLYLPIRAAADPLLNWGRPSTLGRLLEHVTGGQYQGLMFDFSVASDQLGWFFNRLSIDFFWIGLLLVVPGVIILFKENQRRLNFVSILLLTTLLFSGTYAIREIEPFFLTALMALGFFLATGLAWAEGKGKRMLLIPLLILLPLRSIVAHYGEVDRSDQDIAHHFAEDLLNGLPEKTILFTGRWDYVISPTLYAQHVDGVRTDVTVANVNMLHDRVYLSQLVARHPQLGRASEQIEGFLKERALFDAGEAGREGLYRRAYIKLVNGMIAAYEGPVYVTPEVDTLVGLGLHRVPHNLAIALREEPGYVTSEPGTRALAGESGPDLVDRVGVALYYGEMASLRAEYEERSGFPDRAGAFRESITLVAPSITEEEVPLLPLGNRAYVIDVLEWFQRNSREGGER